MMLFSASVVGAVCGMAFLWGFFSGIGRRMGEDTYPALRKWLI